MYQYIEIYPSKFFWFSKFYGRIIIVTNFDKNKIWPYYYLWLMVMDKVMNIYFSIMLVIFQEHKSGVKELCIKPIDFTSISKSEKTFQKTTWFNQHK